MNKKVSNRNKLLNILSTTSFVNVKGLTNYKDKELAELIIILCSINVLNIKPELYEFANKYALSTGLGI